MEYFQEHSVKCLSINKIYTRWKVLCIIYIMFQIETTLRISSQICWTSKLYKVEKNPINEILRLTHLSIWKLKLSQQQCHGFPYIHLAHILSPCNSFLHWIPCPWVFLTLQWPLPRFSPFPWWIKFLWPNSNGAFLKIPFTKMLSSCSTSDSSKCFFF